MAKQTITVRRRHAVERDESVEVEFPVYVSDTDNNYADNVPYESTEALIRIEESSRVTTANRTREECSRRRDLT